MKAIASKKHEKGNCNGTGSAGKRDLNRAMALALLTGLIGLHGGLAAAQPPAKTEARASENSRLLVEAMAGLSDAELDKILKPHGGKHRKLGQSNLHIVDLPSNQSAAAVVEKLAHHPHLKFAELDRRVESTLAVNDPYMGSAWHLPKVGAPAAWDSTQGAGITIAILDSGVDPTHPDLSANLVAGFNVATNNADTSDVCGHGTAVAGTAAASTNNARGVAGVAGQAKIMPIRIANFDAASGKCFASYRTVANGLTWAADHGARIANVSYGGLANSAAVRSAAQYMKNKGGLVFISAGNSGIDENSTPTTTLIPVSATGSTDVITSWSSFGSFVALSAPGAGIWTTSQGGLYGAWSGTSFSSPLAAGVAALMMAAKPSFTGAQIESLMYSSAVDLGTPGRDPYYGYGRVDAAAGVKAVLATNPVIDTMAPASAISAPLSNSTVTGLVAVNVTASDNIGVSRVELRVNGATVAIDDAAPFGFSWDSTGVANGMASLIAVAFDAAGNSKASTPVMLNVANGVPVPVVDTTLPQVSITNPVAGAVTGTVAISVSASDNMGAPGIVQTLYIDGVARVRTSGAALAYSWNTSGIATGVHTITALAQDAAGNQAWKSVQVVR